MATAYRPAPRDVPRQPPEQEHAAAHYFDGARNVFYRPHRDVTLRDIAEAPLGALDWGLVAEDPTPEQRAEYEMDELQRAAVLERHPCGEEMRALLNASRSLPVDVRQSADAMKTTSSKGNFRRALEVASQAGGAGGASHSLLYSRGGPARRINTAEIKWGPVRFSDMGTVELGERITREVIELRRAFSKRDAIVTFPDNVTPEALAYTASRFGSDWELFDITKHADMSSAFMKVYIERNASSASGNIQAAASSRQNHADSGTITFDKATGEPTWHRMSGEKALVTSSAFRVSDDDAEAARLAQASAGGSSGPAIVAGQVDPGVPIADSTMPLPPLPERPKGWPKDGPGHPPPSSQEGLRVKRFSLEERVPALKQVLDADRAKQVTAPPAAEVGVKYLDRLQEQDVQRKATSRLPVWRAVRSPAKPGIAEEAELQRRHRAEREADAQQANAIVAARASAMSASAAASSAAATAAGGSSSPPSVFDGASLVTMAPSPFRPGGNEVTPTRVDRSAPRTRTEEGPVSMARLRNCVMTPGPRPEDGTFNDAMLVRAPRVVEERHRALRVVEMTAEQRRAAAEAAKHAQASDGTRIGEIAQMNSRLLSQMLAPPSVPYAEMRRAHTEPMMPFLAVSGVPKFDPVGPTPQATTWKQISDVQTEWTKIMSEI
jgi:hypothetical protein